MYVKDTWRFKYKNEIEIKYLGKYGKKGEKRAKRIKATPEVIAKQNQRNKEKNMHRLIQANFDTGDIWVTLKYPAGHRPSIDEVKKDKANFIKALRKEYKKRNEPFKWIIRAEIGKRGGVHFHMLVSRCWSGHTDLLIQKCWKYTAHTETVHEEVEKLAQYIVKPLPEEAENPRCMLTEETLKNENLIKSRVLENKNSKNPYCMLTEQTLKNKNTVKSRVLENKNTKNPHCMLTERTLKNKNLEKTRDLEGQNTENPCEPHTCERSIFKTYSCSRNLERPKPERKIYTRLTVEKLIRDGITPTKGYSIIKDSIYSGVNPYTGYSYLHYQERKNNVKRKTVFNE